MYHYNGFAQLAACKKERSCSTEDLGLNEKNAEAEISKREQRGG